MALGLLTLGECSKCFSYCAASSAGTYITDLIQTNDEEPHEESDEDGDQDEDEDRDNDTDEGYEATDNANEYVEQATLLIAMSVSSTPSSDLQIPNLCSRPHWKAGFLHFMWLLGFSVKIHQFRGLITDVYRRFGTWLYH